MFRPDYMLGGVCEIDVPFLIRAGVKGLILDIDNTLAVPDKREIPADIVSWLKQMKQAHVPMVILSNNTADRIRGFAEEIGLPFVDRGGKPLRRGYIRAAETLGVPLYRLAAVGDQLFTDIWGGNRAKTVTVLTAPFAPDQTAFIRLKRIAERPLLKKYKKKERV